MKPWTLPPRVVDAIKSFEEAVSFAALGEEYNVSAREDARDSLAVDAARRRLHRSIRLALNKGELKSSNDREIRTDMICTEIAAIVHRDVSITHAPVGESDSEELRGVPDPEAVARLRELVQSLLILRLGGSPA